MISMRRFLLIAMIIMLPLRGMVGDAMAMQMTSQPFAQAVASEAVATDSVAVHAYPTKDIGNLDTQIAVQKTSGMPCHDMLGQDVSGTDDAAQQSSSNACTSCQVCHLSALTSGSVTSVSVNTAHPALAFAPHYWASAELSQSTKPPVF